MKKIGLAVSAYLLPVVAFGQTLSGRINNADSLVTFIKNLIDTVIPIIIAIAVVYFLWGLFRLFTAADDEKKDKAKNTILYGVIALFVMVSIWGLVNILVGTFDLDTNAPSNLDELVPVR